LAVYGSVIIQHLHGNAGPPPPSTLHHVCKAMDVVYKHEQVSIGDHDGDYHFQY